MPIEDISEAERLSIYRAHLMKATYKQLATQFRRSEPRIKEVVQAMKKRSAPAAQWDSVQYPGWRVHGDVGGNPRTRL